MFTSLWVPTYSLAHTLSLTSEINIGWCLVSILGLMTSRLLNVWVIKQRAKPLTSNEEKDDPSPKRRRRSRSPSRAANSSSASLSSSDPGASSRRRSRSRISIACEEIVSYIIHLGDDNGKTKVKLRGTPSDLRQLTSRAWLRSKTHLEGYIEATAKLIVYLVAALSGNMTQVGALIMMVLLLVSAGLLALSNHRAKAFRVGGVVAVVDDEGDKKGEEEQKKKKDRPDEKEHEQVRNAEDDVEVEDGDGRGRRHAGRENTAVRLAAGVGPADGGEPVVRGNAADLAERGLAGPRQQHIKWEELRKPPGQPAPRPTRGPKLDPRD